MKSYFDWWVKRERKKEKNKNHMLRLRNASERVIISHHSSLFLTAQPVKLTSISRSGTRPLKYFTYNSQCPSLPQSMLFKMKDSETVRNPSSLMKQRQYSSHSPLHMFILFFHLSVSLKLKHTQSISAASIMFYWGTVLLAVWTSFAM